MSHFDLDIILPCYNPIAGWEKTIVNSTSSIQKSLPQQRIRVILVNDGSQNVDIDSGVKYLREKLTEFEFVDVKVNAGKGNSVRQGLAASSADICIYTDVDFPYQEDSFIELYKELLLAEHDVIVGVKSADYYEQVPWHRKLISKCLILLSKTFLRISITDTQCGLKGFNAKGKAVMQKTEINRYLFDLEFIYLCEHDKNIKIKAMPVQLKPDVEFSNMPMSILLKEGWNFLKVIFRNS